MYIHQYKQLRKLQWLSSSYDTLSSTSACTTISRVTTTIKHLKHRKFATQKQRCERLDTELRHVSNYWQLIGLVVEMGLAKKVGFSSPAIITTTSTGSFSVPASTVVSKPFSSDEANKPARTLRYEQARRTRAPATKHNMAAKPPASHVVEEAWCWEELVLLSTLAGLIFLASSWSPLLSSGYSCLALLQMDGVTSVDKLMTLYKSKLYLPIIELREERGACSYWLILSNLLLAICNSFPWAKSNLLAESVGIIVLWMLPLLCLLKWFLSLFLCSDLSVAMRRFLLPHLSDML